MREGTRKDQPESVSAGNVDSPGLRKEVLAIMQCSGHGAMNNNDNASVYIRSGHRDINLGLA